MECRPPKGGTIQLVSAVDVSKPFAAAVEACVKDRNGGMYALVLHADDPRGAAAHLAERGVATTGATPPEATISGARFLLV